VSEAEALLARVGQAYAPLLARVEGWAAAHGPRLIVGVCGSQGSGKSTVCAALAAALGERGFRIAVVSLDDLYLTRAAREDLARRVHPLFATRGPPGTHDTALGEAVLDGLRGPGRTLIPRFDKGRDDRRPQAEWTRFDGPADVVLFEGWCVGARPQPPEALIPPVNALERLEDPGGLWRGAVDAALAGPYRRLFARLDKLVLLQAPGFEAVAGWRGEQEAKLRFRSNAAAALAPELIGRFVAHYERLTRWILEEMPGRADLTIALDGERRPLWPASADERE